MRDFLMDLCRTFRSLSRARGLSLAVIGILGLGIGGTTAIFSVLYAELLKPLPLHRPEQLVMFAGSVTAPPGEHDRVAFWSRARSLQSVAEMGRVGGVNLGLPGETVYVPAAEVSAGFFATLQEAPYLGRTFLPYEEHPGSNNVVVLSYGLWQRAFGGDGSAVGRSLRINGAPVVIVGVLKRGFVFPYGAEMWIPRDPKAGAPRVGEPESSKTVNELFAERLIARLADSVTFEQAQAEIGTMWEEMHGLQEKAGLGSGAETRLVPLARWGTDTSRRALLGLLLAAGFVLLIAAANATNLLLARAATRRKEVAVRLCLGASRWKIMQQGLGESLLLSAAGCIAGLAVALVCTDLIRRIGPEGLLRLQEVRVNQVVLLFATGLAAVTGLLVGLAPAAQAGTADLTTALKTQGTCSAGGFARRARAALVVAEISLACALLVVAGIMVQSFLRLMAADSGFDVRRVVAFSLTLPSATYEQPPKARGGVRSPAASEDWRDARPTRNNEPGRAATFQRELLDALRAFPGVVEAGITARLPIADSFGMVWVGPSNDQGTLATKHNVSGDYFQAMGIALSAGRYLSQSDYARDDTVVISESLAGKLWPGRNPLGQPLQISWNGKQIREVVGVVPDTAVDRLDDYPPARVQFYVPDTSVRNFTVVVRLRGDIAGFKRSVRAAVRALDADVSVFRLRTLQEVVDESARGRKFLGQLLSALAGTAILLATLGVAAVMAYSVATRTHEMGVRMALGALRGDVLRMVLREGLRLALAGVLLGLLAAWWLSRYIAGLLYGISATDSWTYIVTAVVLVTGALLGSLLPALRASRVDPAVALRYE